MFGLHAYDKRKDNLNGATYFHGGRPLTEDLYVNPLIYLCFNINCIDTLINTLDKNISWRCLDYQDKMKYVDQKYPTEIKKPTPQDFKIKRQTLLDDIDRTWYLSDMKNTKPPIKRPRLT